MCGIAGEFAFAGEVAPARVVAMTKALRHRGPDDEGYVWCGGGTAWPASGDETVPSLPLPSWRRYEGQRYRVGLGHRRLSILDPSPSGHQPMVSSSGRFWIVYNGEIYNYVELREELRKRGYRFTTASDTEVILAAFEEWGEACQSRLRGMWAWTLYDLAADRLHCSRDPFGIKPLYWARDSQRFVFASDIRSLLGHPAVPKRAHPRIVREYVAYGRHEQEGETFFEGIWAVPPGCQLRVDGENVEVLPHTRLVRVTVPSRFDDAAAEFRELASRCIARSFRSDVPSAICLSGGLDSAAIAAVAAEAGLRTTAFTCIFPGEAFDEGALSRQTATRAGLPLVEVHPESEDPVAQLESAMNFLDQPSTSPAVLAHQAMVRLIAGHKITVALNGQGADELLAGYNYYVPYLLKDRWRDRRLRDLLAGLSEHGQAFSGGPRSVLRSFLGVAAGESVFGSWWQRRPGHLNREVLHDAPRLASSAITSPYEGALRARQMEDLYRAHLPGILHYEDRSSMAVGLEMRVPFLDVDLANFVLSLPVEWSFGRGRTKHILRAAFAKDLAPEVLELRMKRGFPTPAIGLLAARKAHWVDIALRNRSLDAILRLDGLAAKLREWRPGEPGDDLTLFRCIMLLIWSRAVGL